MKNLEDKLKIHGVLTSEIITTDVFSRISLTNFSGSAKDDILTASTGFSFT